MRTGTAMDFKTSFTGIFESILQNQPLFKEKEALRHSYIPTELPHREKEIRQLATILAPVLRGETPSNILIYGKSGTGKSITCRFICNELYNTGSKMGIPVERAYINCQITDTKYRVLQSLAKDFGERIPFTGWPTEKVYKTFKEAIDKRKRYIIIVLDEVDKIVTNNGDNVINTLTKINKELKNANISIVGISNDIKFTSNLDKGVRNSIGEEEILFRPYDIRQLEEILNKRAEIAFKEGVIDEYVIPLCAALATKEYGDAKKALDLLRVSGEIAERECAERITEKHVRKAKDKIENDLIVEAIRTLPTQTKLILYAVILLEEKKKQRITTGEVYSLYKSFCREISMDALTSRRVSDLILELDLLGICKTTVVSKGRYGRTREINLEIPTINIRLVLEDDVRLKVLLDDKNKQKTQA